MSVETEICLFANEKKYMRITQFYAIAVSAVRLILVSARLIKRRRIAYIRTNFNWLRRCSVNVCVCVYYICSIGVSARVATESRSIPPMRKIKYSHPEQFFLSNCNSSHTWI